MDLEGAREGRREGFIPVRPEERGHTTGSEKDRERSAAVGVYDELGACVDATDALCSLLGRPRSALVGRRLDETLIECEPESVARLRRRVAESGSARERLHLFIPGRGQRCLDLAATGLLPRTGRHWQITWSDVTDSLGRRTPEPRRGVDDDFLQILTRRHDDLDRHIQAVLEAALQHFGAVGAVVSIDRGTRTWFAGARCRKLAVEPATARELGRTIEEVLAAAIDGKEAAPSLRIGPEAIPAAFAPLGTRCLLAAPLDRIDGVAEGFVVILDPTEPSAEEPRLSHLALAAQSVLLGILRRRADDAEVDRLVGREFMGTVARLSHRINNHLTCVLGQTWQLSATTTSETVCREASAAIEEAAQAAARTSSALQLFALESESRRAPVDVAAVMAAAIETFEPKRRGIEVSCSLGDELPPVDAVRPHLSLAFLELLRDVGETEPAPEAIRVELGRSLAESGGLAIEIRSERRAAPSYLETSSPEPSRRPPRSRDEPPSLEVAARIIKGHAGRLRGGRSEASGRRVWQIELPAASATAIPII